MTALLLAATVVHEAFVPAQWSRAAGARLRTAALQQQRLCKTSMCGQPADADAGRGQFEMSRRAFTSAVMLTAAAPVLTPWAAIADESPAPSCGYADLQGLPTVLVKASNQASGGGGKGTQKVLQDEPLLADPKRFSAALDACAAEDSAKKEALAKFASLEEEIQYNLGKSFDPRWPDEDDIADLQSSVKRLKAAVEKCIASVPAAQRDA